MLTHESIIYARRQITIHESSRTVPIDSFLRYSAVGLGDETNAPCQVLREVVGSKAPHPVALAGSGGIDAGFFSLAEVVLKGHYAKIRH